METILNWKKGIFQSSYKIYSRENFVGSLKEMMKVFFDRTIMNNTLLEKELLFKSNFLLNHRAQKIYLQQYLNYIILAYQTVIT